MSLSCFIRFLCAPCLFGLHTQISLSHSTTRLNAPSTNPTPLLPHPRRYGLFYTLVSDNPYRIQDWTCFFLGPKRSTTFSFFTPFGIWKRKKRMPLRWGGRKVDPPSCNCADMAELLLIIYEQEQQGGIHLSSWGLRTPMDLSPHQKPPRARSPMLHTNHASNRGSYVDSNACIIGHPSITIILFLG